MVKICRTELLKLNFEIIPKKRIFRFLPKIAAGHGWSWNFFFANFQILGPLGCQGWVVIPQNVKKNSKSLHPNVHLCLISLYMGSGFLSAIFVIFKTGKSFVKYNMWTDSEGMDVHVICEYLPVYVQYFYHIMWNNRISELFDF